MRSIPRLRWWIGGLLFASTVINYIDRQTLNALGPILKTEFQWSNSDFATILISFRLAYTIMQAVGGRIIDVLGTRRGLTISVAFYSAVAMLTSLTGGITGFRIFRFLLGLGEGPNWPAAAKATAEWFPAKERGWAVALYDSGSAVGGAIAPFLVLWAYRHFGSWRPVFLVTGSLGFLWLIAWLLLYHLPSQHPRISKEELELIQREVEPPAATQVGWRQLLHYPQTWGIVVGRALIDPYWFLVADWFAIYLISKGFNLESSILGFWLPFLAADLGNFCGGGVSSWLIGRGWPVGRARRAVLLVFGPAMLGLIPAAFTSNYLLIITLFGLASFSYAACATIFLAFPGDVFRSNAVASVSGLSGAGAGLATLLSTYLIGTVTDRFSFQPVIITASIVPCIATAVLVSLVRAPKRQDPRGLLNQF